MITKKDVKTLLEILGFTKVEDNSTVYTKYYTATDCSIRVDVGNERIQYPIEQGMRVTRQTTTDFSHNESFVVLECVDRLLEKGYRPEDIELEKKWSLGHRLTGGEDSGFADICVYSGRQTPDEAGTVLFIIECKTFGREFDTELKNMSHDGGQLFSYWQQERASQYLVLYASDILDDSIEYRTETVVCQDDPNILKFAEKDTDETIRLYRQAHSVTDLFGAWSETYEQRLVGDVIFRADSSAYHPDIKPLRKGDLRDFSENDKVVNRFEEILRHNNVSDKENAFNRLIALFICKLVDEMQKADDDEVEFQYKVGTDTYESLQDRLQRLHKEGMERFMREKIFYVPDDYAETVVKQYAGKRRENLIKELRDTLRVLKFFTNNDFAFKDVHNEELFYQNGKIVVEMVQLFEHYRIIGSSDIQTLGDLFEQLLNKGFKQNEGQFFTPVPIARFIWDSLPIQEVVRTTKGIDYPKVIDYACGAGHFLTQGVEAVNAAVQEVSTQTDINRSWVATKLYGVEKDYRLARVSKISLFMHGAGDANIIFGDGLENYLDKGIEVHSFDILVANPPYAVKAFKSHMKLKNNEFQIMDDITNEGSEIETLFVERIAQLLKPNGIAAVILPSSILSNESAPYTAAREQLLQNFYIRAIAGFGSKTFGATGTNTVVLFLERIEEPPVRFNLIADSAQAILSGTLLAGWEDHDIYDAYLGQLDISDDEYQLFIAESEPYQYFRDTKYLKSYVTDFEKQTYVKAKQKQKSFQRLSAQDQQYWLDREFYKYVKTAEFKKIQYFAMVYQQTVLVITAPGDNRSQKEFLGYDWSNRKGNEGIVITKPGGMLYNPDDRFDSDTLAGLVRDSFVTIQRDLPKYNNYYGYVRLVDMINFERLDFIAAIHLNTRSKVGINSKYPLKSLSEECFSVSIGRRVLVKEVTAEGTYPVYSANVKEIFGYTERLLLPNFDVASVLWGIDGDWMTSYIPSGQPFYPTDHCGVLRVNCDDIDPYYVSMALETVGKNYGFSRSFRASTERIKEVKIPIPPIRVQRTIVSQCMKIDEEYQTTRMAIEEYRAKIEKMFVDLEIIGGGLRLDSIAWFVSERISGALINSDVYVTTDNMLKNAEGVTDFNGVIPESGVHIYKVNDILLSNIRPYLRKIWQADRDGGASTDVLVLRVKAEYDPRFLYYQMRRKKYFDYVMENVSGVKMPRGKKPHILKFQVLDIPLPEQAEIVDQISQIDATIRELKQKMISMIEKKKGILSEYL